MTSRPYLPTDDPGQLLFWGDVRVAANVTTDSSGNVSALATRGGIIPTVGASSGYPVLNAGALNGLDALSFPSNGLDAAIATALAAGTPVNIFFVGNLPASQSGYARSGALQQSKNGNDAYGGLSLISTGTDTSTVTGYNLFNGPSTQVSPNTTHVFSAYTLDGTTSNIAIDGQGVVSGTQKPFYTSPLAGFSLGWSGGDGPWPSLIGEYIVLIGNMTQDRVDKMRGYLAWGWNNQSKLAANDPYANAAPTVASSASADTAASGAFAPVTASPPAATVGADASAAGSLPSAMASPLTASVSGAASAIGSIAAALASPLQAVVTGAALAMGIIAPVAAYPPAATVSGDAAIAGSFQRATASPPTASVAGGGLAQGTLPPAAATPPSASVGADAGASGSIAGAVTLPMQAVAGGDAGASGALPTVTASPPTATAAGYGPSLASGSFPIAYATPPVASVGASATCAGSIAPAQAISATATAGGSASAVGGLASATAAPSTAITTGAAGASGSITGVTATSPTATVQIIAPSNATGGLPGVVAVPISATVSGVASASGSLASAVARPPSGVAFGAMAHAIAYSPTGYVRIGPAIGVVAQGWALAATPRRFTGQATRRIFAITIGGSYKMNFPPKYAAEVRNASVDFTPDLADGEELTGDPSVVVVAGDVAVSNVGRDGAVVHFTLAGGSRTGGIYQTIGISCPTTQGQVLGETASLTIR